MRDSCGLQGNYRWRGGEHTPTHMQEHKSKQSHTCQHTHRVMDTLRNGWLQGENTHTHTHTQVVSRRGADGSWLWLLCWPLTSRWKGTRGFSKTHIHTLSYRHIHTQTLQHFAGRSCCRTTKCVLDCWRVTSHRVEVRITTSWIHFDLWEKEREIRVSRSYLYLPLSICHKLSLRTSKTENKIHFRITEKCFHDSFWVWDVFL